MFEVALADPPQMAARWHHPAHLQRLFVWLRCKSPPGVQTLDTSQSKRWGGGGGSPNPGRTSLQLKSLFG